MPDMCFSFLSHGGKAAMREKRENWARTVTQGSRPVLLTFAPPGAIDRADRSEAFRVTRPEAVVLGTK
jgi:hypothetical protein